MEAHYIAGHSVFRVAPLPRHEFLRLGQTNRLSCSGDDGVGSGLEASGAHPEECHAVSMFEIHVGLDLEHETGKR